MAGVARAQAAQLAFGPVDAGRAYALGQRRIIGDKQDEATLVTGAGERKAGGEARALAEMTPDDTEAARQALCDLHGIRRADRVGDEEGAGEGAAGLCVREASEARGDDQLAAGSSLTLRGGRVRGRHGRNASSRDRIGA